MASDSGLHVAGNAIQAELPPTLSKPVPHGKPAPLADCSYPPQDAATKPSDTDKDARRDTSDPTQDAPGKLSGTDKDALRATSNPAHNAPGKLSDTDKDALRATSDPAQDAARKLSDTDKDALRDTSNPAFATESSRGKATVLPKRGKGKGTGHSIDLSTPQKLMVKQHSFDSRWRVDELVTPEQISAKNPSSASRAPSDLASDEPLEDLTAETPRPHLKRTHTDSSLSSTPANKFDKFYYKQHGMQCRATHVLIVDVTPGR